MSSAFAQYPLQIGLGHIAENKELYQLNEADVSDYVVSDQYVSKKNGVTHIYLRQRFQGIEVEGAILNINLGPEGNLINMGSRFVPNLQGAVKASVTAITPVQAVGAAAQNLQLPLQEAWQIEAEKSVSGNGREVLVSKGNISLDPIPVKLRYQPLEDGTVRLAWIVSIYETTAQHYWNVAVDAGTGAVLKKEDQVVHDFGRVHLL